MRCWLIMLALLSGCANNLPYVHVPPEPRLRMVADSNCQQTDFNLQFESDMPHQPMIVDWKIVSDPHAVCKDAGSFHRNGSTIVACAVRVQNRCTIYSAKTTNLAVIGHETRHCFEGNWHR